MQAGKLRNRIDLQRKTETRNVYHEPVESWATYASCWAGLVSGAGVEQLLGQQVTGKGVVAITIRYRNPEPAVDERVKLGSRTFDINDVDNVNQRNRELVLTCTEVTS